MRGCGGGCSRERRALEMWGGHLLGNRRLARPVATRRRVGGAWRRGKLAAEAAPTREESSRASSRGCVTCGLLRGGLRGVRGRCRFGRRRLGFGGVGLGCGFNCFRLGFGRGRLFCHAVVLGRCTLGGGLLRRGAAGGLVAIGVGELFLAHRSEEHTSELQSLMRLSYAVLCLKKKK